MKSIPMSKELSDDWKAAVLAEMNLAEDYAKAIQEQIAHNRKVLLPIMKFPPPLHGPSFPYIHRPRTEEEAVEFLATATPQALLQMLEQTRDDAYSDAWMEA